MNWVDFLHADCDTIILVRPTLHFISFTFKCQSTAVVLVRPLAVAVRILGKGVCPSFHHAVFLGVFLRIGSLDFSEFWHSARNPYEIVHDRARVFNKNLFAPKLWEMGQK